VSAFRQKEEGSREEGGDFTDCTETVQATIGPLILFSGSLPVFGVCPFIKNHPAADSTSPQIPAGAHLTRPILAESPLPANEQFFSGLLVTAVACSKHILINSSAVLIRVLIRLSSIPHDF
jgi:hypothetical protein